MHISYDKSFEQFNGSKGIGGSFFLIGKRNLNSRSFLNLSSEVGHFEQSGGGEEHFEQSGGGHSHVGIVEQSGDFGGGGHGGHS